MPLTLQSRTVAELKLEHWRDYTKTFDSTKAISDIFANNVEDYEAVTASEAFAEVGSDIYSAHNISIGKTTAPTSKLDVAGTVTATAAIFSGDVAVNTNTLFVDTSANSVGLGTVTPSANLHVTGNVYVSSNLEVGTANLFVDTVNSRVGVGKTNPDTALDVVGTVTATALVGTNLYGTLLGSNAASVSSLTASGTVKGTDLIGTNLYGTLLGSNAASVSSLTASGTVKGTDLIGTNLYGTLLGSNAASVSSLTASGDVAFDTNTLFVDSTENRVGVGTDSPQYRLDVGYGGGATAADDVMLRVMSSSGTSGKLIFGRSGTTDIRSHAIETYNSSGADNNYMKFLVHDGTGTAPYETRTEVMTLRGDGNVGIGTTSPNTKLDVISGTNNGIRISATDTNNNWRDMKYFHGDGSGTGYMIMGNCGTEAVSIDSSQSVGIGTTSPNTKLDVISGTNNGIRISATDTNNNWRDINIRSYGKFSF